MANTIRIPLLVGINFLDDNCWKAPYLTLNSGTTQNPMVLVMEQGVVSQIMGKMVVPAFTGTPDLEIIWTSETTTGNVDYIFRHRPTTGSDSELLDTSTTPTEAVQTTGLDNLTGPSAASEQMITTQALTVTDWVAGDSLYYELERDGVSDTKGAEVSVWHVNIVYDPA